MDLLKKIFPFSFRTKENDVASLVITIILYMVAGVIAGFVIGLLGIIPLIGILFRLVGSLIELYVFAGIIITLLDYFKVLK